MKEKEPQSRYAKPLQVGKMARGDIIKLVVILAAAAVAAVLFFYLRSGQGYHLEDWQQAALEDTGVTLLVPGEVRYGQQPESPFAYSKQDALGVQVWRYEIPSEDMEDLQAVYEQFIGEVNTPGSYNASSEEEGWQFAQPDYAISQRTDYPHVDGVGLGDDRNCFFSVFPVGEETWVVWLSSEGSTGSVFKTMRFMDMAKEYFDQIQVAA